MPSFTFEIQPHWLKMLKLLAIAVLYILAYRLISDYLALQGRVSVSFIATGLALAALLLGGRIYALSIFFGSVIANLLGGFNLWVAISIAVGCTVNALLSMSLVTYNNKFDLSLASLSDYLRLIILGGFWGSIVGALIDTVTLQLIHNIAIKQFLSELLCWLMDDMLGVVLVTPLILVCYKMPKLQFTAKKAVAGVLIMIAIWLVGQIIFLGWFSESLGMIAKGYWLFAMIALSATYLGRQGTLVILLIIAMQAIIGAIHGVGFFANDIAQTQSLNMYFYLICLSVVGTTLSIHINERDLIEHELRDSEDTFHHLFEDSNDAALLIKNGVFIDCNTAALSLLGYADKVAIINRSPRAISPAYQADGINSTEKATNIIATVLSVGHARFDWQFHRADGSLLSVEVTLSKILLQGETIIHMTWRDISERKRAETELQIAATIFESQEGMFITNAECIILKVNHAFTEITGYTADEAVGQDPRLLKSGQQDSAFYTALWQSIKNTGKWRGEIWNRRKDGEIYPQWLTITTVKTNQDTEVTHYVATLIDISERKANEEQIKQLAFYDVLTNLPNRRSLYERMKYGINLARRDGKLMAILMLDLDKFKAVNDSLGHAAGDLLLQQVANRITARLRDIDMVARLGGDEFVVLLDDIRQNSDIEHIASDIITTLSQPFRLQNNNVHIGASIGISLYPQHGDSPEILLDDADAALYLAKKQGRGCFAYFSNELTQIAHERVNLEKRLRLAVEQQELRVFYQPACDIITGRIIGAEALVRWQDPTVGLIFPDDFMPIAETSNLFLLIGKWVLTETCKQGRQWLNAGLPALTLTVNVSTQQFRRSDINNLVATVVAETGFPATQLELEISEEALMTHQEQALAILTNLNKPEFDLSLMKAKATNRGGADSKKVS
jgi:diguanylate cyclase (GGDEF)-like protein/PAS domain S-box-containing protein